MYVPRPVFMDAFLPRTSRPARCHCCPVVFIMNSRPSKISLICSTSGFCPLITSLETIGNLKHALLSLSIITTAIVQAAVGAFSISINVSNTYRQSGHRKMYTHHFYDKVSVCCNWSLHIPGGLETPGNSNINKCRL